MKRRVGLKRFGTFLITLCICGTFAVTFFYLRAKAAVSSITTIGTAFTENFDGIGSSATATLPTGWRTDSGTATTVFSSAATVTTQAADDRNRCNQ